MSKHKPIPKRIREKVYLKYNGHCAYCGCALEYKDMQVDHIKSVYVHNEYLKDMTTEELNDIENLMPACRSCNFYKAEDDIETFRKRLETTLVRNLQKPFDYRLALKYGMIEEKFEPVKFYFEECEK